MAGGGGVPWAERARAVQARIRDRFRVAAVDRRWQWRRAEGGARASAALRRWADRVMALWQGLHPDHAPPAAAAAAGNSSSGSFRFYRKKVSKDVNAADDSVIIRLLQALAVPLIGNACHVFMHGLNSVQVSNHVAAIDDPFVIASLLPPSVMLDAQKLRWTLCATDRCFTNPIMSSFFRSVKVLPVSRGDGIYQKGMDMALSKLNNGGWVHIFPEGSRSKDGGKTIAPAKRGVGRLVMDADNLPIVIPFVHTGMHDIMPAGTHFPKTGKRVIVVVGDPINFDDLIINNDDSQHTSRGVLYDEATRRIGQRLQELKAEVDRLTQEQQMGLQNYYIRTSTDGDDGYLLWQQVDWEAFGIRSSMSSSEPAAFIEDPLEPPSMQGSSPTSGAACSHNSGSSSWMRSYLDPAELVGFAARGLFMEGRRRELPVSDPW